MDYSLFPICEYDETPVAIIQPDKNDYDFVLPEKCIAIFFKDIVVALSSLPNVSEIGRVQWETGDVVYYLYHDEKGDFCFYHSWVGAPISAAVLDLSIALGVRRVLSIGGCGILRKDLIDDMTILLPTSGIRDEGTSYHYVEPSVSITPSLSFLTSISSYLDNKAIGFKCVKTWTTDGFYRETKARAARRKEQGCEVVEMEFSALCAVAKKRGAEYAAILYAGDIVECDEYDERDWQNNHCMRSSLFGLAKDIILGG